MVHAWSSKSIMAPCAAHCWYSKPWHKCWTPNLMFGKPTWTWNNADYSYRFMKNTYFKAFDSPWMDVGGLIYVDWNGADTDNAKNRAIRAVRWGYESSSATSEPSQC